MTQDQKDDKTPSADRDAPTGGPAGEEAGASTSAGAGETGGGPEGAAGAEQELRAEEMPDAEGEGQEPGDNAALAVIQRFGGIRPMANKLGIAVSTVQGWKNRGAIPESRHEEILEAARRNDIELDRSLLQASGEADAEAATETAAGSPWGAAGEPETVEAEPVTDAPAGGPAGSAETVAATAAAAAPPRRPRGWLPGMFLGAALLVVGAGAAIYGRAYWQPYLPQAGERVQPASQEDLADLRQTVSDLAGRLEGVQGDLAQVRQTAEQAAGTAEQAAGAAAGEQVAQLEERVGELAGRLDSLAQQVQAGAAAAAAGDDGGTAPAAADGQVAARLNTLSSQVTQLSETAAGKDTVGQLSDRVDQLGQQVAQLESQIGPLAELQQRIGGEGGVREVARTIAAQQTAQGLAVAELRDALRFSSPFEEQLTAARQVVPAEGPLAQALDKLEPMAAKGVPTRAELSSAFDRAAAQAVAADMGASQDGMLGGVLRRLNDVVTVRRVDAEGGSGVNATLARAESKLAAGDLNEAVQIVEGLAEPAKGEMQGWLEQARARLAAERALSALSARLMETLAAPGGAQDGSGE